MSRAGRPAWLHMSRSHRPIPAASLPMRYRARLSYKLRSGQRLQSAATYARRRAERGAHREGGGLPVEKISSSLAAAASTWATGRARGRVAIGKSGKQGVCALAGRCAVAGPDGSGQLKCASGRKLPLLLLARATALAPPASAGMEPRQTSHTRQRAAQVCGRSSCSLRVSLLPLTVAQGRQSTSERVAQV